MILLTVNVGGDGAEKCVFTHDSYTSVTDEMLSPRYT